jgi:hypothetical protein
MNTKSRALAERIEKATGFVTVTFVKKTGEVRTMNCRVGVTKHLKGGVSYVNPEQYVTVYDMQSEGYRSINRDTIVDVKGLRDE